MASPMFSSWGGLVVRAYILDDVVAAANSVHYYLATGQVALDCCIDLLMI